MIDRRAMLVGAAAATLAGRAAPAAARAGGFPDGFLWGAATAPHQVEGNNANSDVWALEHVVPTVYAEPSGDAANSFALWPTDLDLVRGLGLNSYRFGIEWARIEPAPGQFSVAMLDHYKAMIEGCRSRGLTSLVTFNHFTTPRWFAERGGWSSPEAPDLFARYCDRAARHLAEPIGYATTLNEPNLSGLLPLVLPQSLVGDLVERDRRMNEAAAKAYAAPRFMAGNALAIDDVAVVSRNMRAAHREGRLAIKATRPDLPVGVSLAIADDQAAGPDSLRDAMRAKLYLPWLEAARGDDFVGVQNYQRQIWDARGRRPTPNGVRVNDAGAELHPPSLANAVRYAHEVSGIPVIVTEHGAEVADDRLRAWFIPAALASLQALVAEGVPVGGYLHWSLVDNFEWVFGYGPKFGLHSLDRTTFRRTPKPSAAVLGAIARRNAV